MKTSDVGPRVTHFHAFLYVSPKTTFLTLEQGLYKHVSFEFDKIYGLNIRKRQFMCI